MTLQKWSIISKTMVGFSTMKNMNEKVCIIKCKHVYGPKIV